MMSLSPYLVYNGTCEAAFHFYQQIFGGQILYIGRYKDVPPEARKVFPNALDESVMHATLKINETTVLMGNDSADPAAQLPPAPVKDFYLYMDIDDPKQAIRMLMNWRLAVKY